MKEQHQPLFESKTINDRTFANRYVVAPMTRVSAENNGTPNETMKKYYERYAKGGFGTVITEGVYPDERFSQGYPNQPGLANEAQRDAWKPIVKSVQEHGALFIAQIMHAGAQSQENPYAEHNIGPSQVAPKNDKLSFYGGEGPFPEPKRMSHDDIQTAVESFGRSAELAKEAGFDGVEIHGANGYLIDQFLTDYFNRREDEFGGDTKNRLRFALQVIKEVRKKVGKDFIVGIRISQGKASDADHRWALGESDADTIFSTLGSESLDYIHVTDDDAEKPGFGQGSMSMAEAAKKHSGIPVIANGKLADPEKAVYMLNNGHADFVSLGTSALQNPDAPKRIKQEKALEEFDFGSIMLPQAHIKDHELNKHIIV